MSQKIYIGFLSLSLYYCKEWTILINEIWNCTLSEHAIRSQVHKIQCERTHTGCSFPQHFSTPCGKLCRRTPEKLAQGTVVSYYTSKGIRFLRYCKYIWYIVTYHLIHWLFPGFMLILGGCLSPDLKVGRGSVDCFLEKSYPWLYTLILTYSQEDAMYKMIPGNIWYRQLFFLT